MDRGELVPDEIVIGLVEEQLQLGTIGRVTGFVLDGFPRTRRQAEELDRILDGRTRSTSRSTSTSRPRSCCTGSPAAACARSAARTYHVDTPPEEQLDVRRVRREGRAARRRHRGRGDAPARALRDPDAAGDPVLPARRRRSPTSTAATRATRSSSACVEPVEIAVRPAEPVRRRPMITRKNAEQIAIMRRAGKVVAEMHEVCIRAAKPGATTLDVDAAAREVIDRRGARSNFLSYHGFPAVVCTSPNDVIVHGIPSDDGRARGGRHPLDRLRGDHRGLARRRRGHRPDRRDRRRVPAADRRDPGLARRRHRRGRGREPPRRHRRRGRGPGRGGRLHRGAGVRRPRHRHGDARGAPGPQLRPGGAGHEAQGGPRARHRADGQRRRPETEVLADGWTVVTRDGRRSAHFEHTIAVTEHGPRS